MDADKLRPELEEFVLALLDASSGLGLEVAVDDAADESADLGAATR